MNINTGNQNPLLGSATDVLGIYGGSRQGGVAGDVRAGASAASLGSRLGALPKEVGYGAGIATDVLGIYSGVKQGGAMGDLTAGVNAAKLGADTGLLPSEVGGIAGDIAAPLALYNFAKGWKSGATGSDVLLGAQAGGAIGSIIPGVGTLIGMGVGAAVGAASSLFGPGKQDPETIGWDQYAAAYKQHGAAGVTGASPSTNYQMLAGIFDARGSNIPFYGKYGRMGENQFMQGMTQTINQALARGQISPTDSPQAIYSKAVEPWINAMSPGGWKDTSTIQGAPEKQAIGNLLTQMIGEYQSGQQGQWTGVSGQAPQVQGFGSLGNTAGSAQGRTARVQSTVGSNSAMAAGQPLKIGPNYQTNDPTSAALMGAGALGASAIPGMMQNPSVPQPPQAGTSTQDSPDGTAASPGSLGSNLFGAPNANDPLSGLGTYGVLTGLGLFGANQATKSNQAAVSPLYSLGQPAVSAGNTLLNRGLTGQLTPLQQQNLTTTQQAGQSLIQGSTQVGQIAGQDFTQYQSGTLKPGDQAQLDAQVAAAKAQVVQTLGPNADSTTAATYFAQIDQQALMTKQQMLNSYFATGNQAYDSWLTGTQAGQQTIIQGQQYAIQQVDQNFQNAFSAFAVGGAPIMQAVADTLQSNSQVAGALSNYSANLAKAYALQKAGAAAGAAGAAGAGASLPASSYVGGSAADQTSMATDINAAGTAATSQTSSDVMSQINTSFANAPYGDQTTGYASYTGYGM